MLSTEIGCVAGKIFVAIQVAPFDQLLVVSRKDGEGLKKGAIYTRATAMNESVPVPGQSEMREILERAADIQLQRLIERLQRAGILLGLSPANGVANQLTSPQKERLKSERGAFE